VLALPGMRRLLVHARPLLLMELHGEKAAQVAWDVLTTARYNLCRMKREYPRIEATEDLGWKAYVVGVPVEGTVKNNARGKGR
jgi:hypothetical protein